MDTSITNPSVKVGNFPRQLVRALSNYTEYKTCDVGPRITLAVVTHGGEDFFDPPLNAIEINGEQLNPQEMGVRVFSLANVPGLCAYFRVPTSEIIDKLTETFYEADADPEKNFSTYEIIKTVTEPIKTTSYPEQIKRLIDRNSDNEYPKLVLDFVEADEHMRGYVPVYDKTFEISNKPGQPPQFISIVHKDIIPTIDGEIPHQLPLDISEFKNYMKFFKHALSARRKLKKLVATPQPDSSESTEEIESRVAAIKAKAQDDIKLIMDVGTRISKNAIDQVNPKVKLSELLYLFGKIAGYKIINIVDMSCRYSAQDLTAERIEEIMQQERNVPINKTCGGKKVKKSIRKKNKRQRTKKIR
jgi:hypothetical protein